MRNQWQSPEWSDKVVGVVTSEIVLRGMCSVNCIVLRGVTLMGVTKSPQRIGTGYIVLKEVNDILLLGVTRFSEK